MRFGRDEEAYKAGLNGEFYFPTSEYQRRSYRKGVNDKPATNNFIFVLMAYWLFLRPAFHYGFYMFLAYQTTTRLYFKKLTDYWDPPHYEFVNTIFLLVTTYVLSYFYVCAGYFLRAKLDAKKSGSDEKWTILTAVLFVLEVAGPVMLAFIILMNSSFLHNYFLLVISSFAGAVLYAIYLKRRYDKRKTLQRDDVSEYLIWAYDGGKGDPNHPVVPINWVSFPLFSLDA